MLEHLVDFLIGNYFGDKIVITKNSEMRDNQQERLLVYFLRRIPRDYMSDIEKIYEDRVRTLW